MRLTPQPRCLSASIAATSSGVRILSLRASPCAEACPTPLSPASSIANPLPCSRGRFHVAREGVSMSADRRSHPLDAVLQFRSGTCSELPVPLTGGGARRGGGGRALPPRHRG